MYVCTYVCVCVRVCVDAVLGKSDYQSLKGVCMYVCIHVYIGNELRRMYVCVLGYVWMPFLASSIMNL